MKVVILESRIVARARENPASMALIGVLPPRVTEKLTDKGFNLEALSELKGDKLNEALNALCVHIDEGSKHVRVFCE